MLVFALKNVSETVRVSIISPTGTTAGCSNLYHAFDMVAGPVESAWVAQLLSAIASQRNVIIAGSAACDSSGDEGVCSIQSR